MASIVAVLRKKPNKQGEYPLAVRVTKERKSSYIYTGQYVLEKHWDEKLKRVKKSHPNSRRLNNLLAKKISAANENLLELETTQPFSSAKTIKEQVKGNYGSKSFFKLSEIYLHELKLQGKHNRVSAETPLINRFREFNKGDITFREINESLLRKYQAYLSSTRKVSDRTIINHLIPIRTLYNRAITDGLVDRKYYPFGKGKIVIKFPETTKLGLDEEEVKQLEGLSLKTGSPAWHAKNVWLFCFYLAGMRVSDALRIKWTDVENGRLYYSMGKNNKADSLKLPPKAIQVINLYEPGSNDISPTIFPELRMTDLRDRDLTQKRIKNADRKFNTHLKNIAKEIGLTKPLKMHIARHTFGNISGDRIPIQMLQKLYRHTVVTTTIGYQSNFKHKDADEALNQTVEF
ncbi:site-specific recombinase XerD [Roseivirga pacifica]|uniref:Site-specific recombinase XerD n=1 Tax=Roseivirga pacifica TaxID=1267423 RepID=A0A1I0MRA8_9BACT|nr:site-specific integrase [Roseivirga pacifica]RKQ50600.1 site-specific recombinase XerD [Roseivirga pacifica]SEV90609.1 Site-specific recombinase XerD [Roseivirga pacifica]